MLWLRPPHEAPPESNELRALLQHVRAAAEPQHVCHQEQYCTRRVPADVDAFVTKWEQTLDEELEAVSGVTTAQPPGDPAPMHPTTRFEVNQQKANTNCDHPVPASDSTVDSRGQYAVPSLGALPLHAEFERFMDSEVDRTMVVLGDAGTGKSSASLALTHDTA